MYTNGSFCLLPDRVEQAGRVFPPADDHGAPAGYPALESDFKVLDSAYRLALRELELLRTPDGCWDTGAFWKGVWTRDLGYSALLSLGLLDPETTRRGLLKKTGPAGIVQDTGTGGSWPVSTDRMIWIPAAWEVYLATGRREWLEEIWPLVERSLAADLATAFDEQTGLLRGESSFLDWRAQSYPAWMDASDIYGSYCLGTNAVHARAWEIAAQCADLLECDSRRYREIAVRIRDGINARLWDSGARQYGQFLYGRQHPIRSPRVESLGAALCVLFGIANAGQAQAAVESLPLEPYGIPCFHPHTPGLPPYHNRGVWPFVVAFGGWAAARAGHEGVAAHALATILRAATIFGTHKENMVSETGAAVGTAINSDRQLWSVAGMVAAVYRMLFGIESHPARLSFAPCVPEAWAGRFTLRNFRWRNASLEIVVSGAGHRVRSFSVDGQATARCEIPADLTGAHRVEIVLEADLKSRVPTRIRPVAYAPATPQLRLEKDRLRWAPIERAVEYRVLVNGTLWKSTQDIFCDPPAGARGAEIQLIAISADGLSSFASAPIVLDEDVLHVGPGDESFIALENNPAQVVTLRAHIPADGRYAVSARYANGQNDSEHDNKCAIRSLRVDGVRAGALVLPQRGKGAWQDYGYSHPFILTLRAGVRVFEVQLTGTDLNMNGAVNEARLSGLRLVKI